MVRNYGFENMNEFYLRYKEAQNVYAEYQQKVEAIGSDSYNNEICLRLFT